MHQNAALAALAVAALTPGSGRAAARPVHRLELPGGALALLVEDHALPQVHVSVTLRVGAAEDPPGKEGLAQTVANLMLRGAGERSREQIEDTADRLGSTLEASVGHTSLAFQGDALTRNLDAFFELVADVVLRPTFPREELDRLARETVADIEGERDDDRALAARFFRRRVFAGHPYGHAALGRIGSIRALSRTDVEGFYRRHLVAGNLVFSAAGDLTRETFAAALERHFGRLPPGAPTAAKAPPAPRPSGRQVLIVDKPERTQVQVFLGHEGVPAAHPDHEALDVANTAFGGTFTARLMQEIRVKHGWSYGAYSRLGSDRDAGNYYLWFFPKTQDAAPAIRRAMELFEELAAHGLTEAELDFARDYSVNALAFATDTAAKHADELVRLEVLGLPPDYLKTLPARTRAVTAKLVDDALARHLHPKDLIVTVLGTAADLKEELAALPGVAGPPEVVPYDAD